MAVKLFVSGEIAYAADINQYFMEQSIAKFATIAERTLAFGDGVSLAAGGTGKPLLKEGQFCYLEDNSIASDGSGISEVQYFNGATWVGASNFAVEDGEITNVKVNATAAIALSKLAPGTSGQIIVANASGVPTYVTLSGDATISNAGVVSIGANNVALGTDTTGDYVATITGGTGVTSTAATTGEGTTHSLSIGQAVGTTSNVQFAAITASSASVTGNVVYHIGTASVASGGALSLSENGKFVELTGNSATLTVPNTSWTIGSQITVMQMGTGSATITFTGATDIKAEPRTSASVVTLRTQYSSATLINRGTADWFVIGDLKV